MAVSRRSRRSRLLVGLSLLVVFSMLLSACGGMPDPREIPFIGDFLGEPEVPTPTPQPTPTNTPEPTATPKPGETPLPPTATPIPVPEVTIPSGFSPFKDDALAYSMAVPRGWTNLDLRSAQFQNMAGMVGMGDALAPLNDFLASPEGDSLGALYITDLMAAMTGGLPTASVVYVLDAPGATPESAKEFVQGMLEANSGMLGDVKIEAFDTCVSNNVPAVCGTLTANTASMGFPAELFGKVVGQVANDKIYVLALLTPLANRAAKEPVFDQIIGTFRPE